jgi:Natural resistance-associated macrophage protein-like
MAISNLVVLFIVITTAATLPAHGVTQIQTSAQAAEALRAVAGPLTFVVFAAGIIRTGMLALAGSAAYALGEALAWHVGLAVCRRVPRRSTRPSRCAWRWAWPELLLHRSDPGALWEHGDDATDHATVDRDGIHDPVAAAGECWLATAAMAVTVIAMIASLLG